MFVIYFVFVISFVTIFIFIFICEGCKQFNAYGFCVHCIMVGSRLAKGLFIDAMFLLF